MSESADRRTTNRLLLLVAIIGVAALGIYLRSEAQKSEQAEADRASRLEQAGNDAARAAHAANEARPKGRR